MTSTYIQDVLFIGNNLKRSIIYCIIIHDLCLVIKQLILINVYMYCIDICIRLLLPLLANKPLQIFIIGRVHLFVYISAISTNSCVLNPKLTDSDSVER